MNSRMCRARPCVHCYIWSILIIVLWFVHDPNQALTKSSMETDSQQVQAFFLIQSDWNEVLWHLGKKAWISLKHYGAPHTTRHGEIVNIGSSEDGNPIFESSDWFKVKSITKRSITISSLHYDVTSHFLAPVQTFSNVHKKSITSMDVSDGGGLGVSSSIDGTFHIWDTSSGSVRRVLEGHLGDVNCCKFFPSGLVVLSGGVDTQLKVWSAEDGNCARTMNGSHKGGVLCLSMVERGRNIVSCARDGTVLLWECGSGTCIATIASGRSEINGCDLVDLGSKLTQAQEDSRMDTAKSDLEIGTEGKLLAIACENGYVEGYDISGKSQLFSLKHTSPLNCCCFINDKILVCGSQDGSVLLTDVDQPRCFLLSMRFCESPVMSLCRSTLSPTIPGFWLSCGNGICALYRPATTSRQDDVSANCHGDSRDGCQYSLNESLSLVCSLTGPDCDPVYKVVEARDGVVYTSCRDAAVRKYNVKHITNS